MEMINKTTSYGKRGFITRKMTYMFFTIQWIHSKTCCFRHQIDLKKNQENTFVVVIQIVIKVNELQRKYYFVKFIIFESINHNYFFQYKVLLTYIYIYIYIFYSFDCLVKLPEICAYKFMIRQVGYLCFSSILLKIDHY